MVQGESNAIESVESPESVEITQQLPSPAATEELAQFCSKHVNALRSFVFFRRGTCVVINEPCADPLAEARKMLENCAQVDARFVSEYTSDGDIVVAFTEPVFHRFTHDQLDHLSPWLDQITPDLLTPAETAATEGSSPLSAHAKAGLLARRHMLEDAFDVMPVGIVRAKNRYTVAR